MGTYYHSSHLNTIDSHHESSLGMIEDLTTKLDILLTEFQVVSDNQKTLFDLTNEIVDKITLIEEWKGLIEQNTEYVNRKLEEEDARLEFEIALNKQNS